MDQSIIDELLSKVKQLENRNQELKDLILSKKQNNLIISQKIQNSHNQTSKNELQEMKDRISYKLNLDFFEQDLILDKDKTNLSNFLQEYSIRFIPNEHYGNMYLMGDFTNWEPMVMNKSRESFIYKVILMKGFKYFYCFQTDDKILLNNNDLIEINQRTGQLNNFIDFNSKDISFDYKLHWNILQENFKNYSKIKFHSKDYIIIKNIIDLGAELRTYINTLIKRKEEDKNILTTKFGQKELFFKTINQYQVLVKSFENRIFMYKGHQFLIHSIDVAESKIKCIMLYDQNHIKVQVDYYFKRNQFLLLKIDISSTEVVILSQLESDLILDSFNKDENSKIKIHYVLLKEQEILKELDEEEDSNINISKSNSGSNQIYREGVVFLKKLPRSLKVDSIINMNNNEELNIDDYQIDISNNMIVDVKNKKDNIKIHYCLQEKINKKNRPQIEIWTNCYKKKFNIIHVHFLTSKPIDVDYFDLEFLFVDNIKEMDLVVNNFKEENFISDKLLIILKNYKISKIYAKVQKNNILLDDSDGNQGSVQYIVKEIEFIENRIFLNSIVRFSNLFNEKSFNKCVGKILKINYDNIYFVKNSGQQNAKNTNNNMDIELISLENCNKDPKSSGLVEVSVNFFADNSIVKQQNNMCVPICKCQLIPMSEAINFEKILEKENKIRESDEMTTLNKLFIECSNFEKTPNNEKAWEFYLKYNDKISKIAQYLEIHEMWTDLEKLSHVSSVFSCIENSNQDRINKN